MDAVDVMARWREFNCEPPWTRRDGSRIIAVSKPCGVREDLVGRLILLTKEDVVVGRDEGRSAKLLSDQLALHMRVGRKEVIGKRAPIKAHRSRKRDCRFNLLDDGTIHKPAPFVTYLTPTGKTYYYRLDDK